MATRPTAPKSPAKTGAAGRPRVAQQPALSVVGDEAQDGDKARPAAGMRLKQLVDLVVAASGGKKKGVKEIVEATLVQMGEALQRGETLNLPGLGKLRVARAGTVGGGAMTLKLRQAAAGGDKAKTDKEPLADADDQD